MINHANQQEETLAISRGRAQGGNRGIQEDLFDHSHLLTEKQSGDVCGTIPGSQRWRDDNEIL